MFFDFCCHFSDTWRIGLPAHKMQNNTYGHQAREHTVECGWGICSKACPGGQRLGQRSRETSHIVRWVLNENGCLWSLSHFENGCDVSAYLMSFYGIHWSAPNRRIWGFSLSAHKCNPTKHVRADVDACIMLIIRACPLYLYCVQLGTCFSILIHDVKGPTNLVKIKTRDCHISARWGHSLC